MRLSELLKGTGCNVSPEQDRDIAGISCNTTTLKPGELFVALRGYKTDGHQYIPQAREKGAAAILGEEGEEVLTVPDSRAALAIVAANWFGHPAKELTMIGVTGTNGKTTTTTLLWGMLHAALGSKIGLIGTNENRIGEEVLPTERTTPDIYELQKLLRQMADAGCTHVVMEVSSHALCLNRVDGIRFAVGAFSNLTQDHLDFHKTMEAYREAKGRLFRQSDVAVLNWDDEAGRHYAKTAPCPVCAYAWRRSGADLSATDVRLLPDRVEFDAGVGEEQVHVRLGIPGSFSVYNALCALGCAHALGIPLETAAKALAVAPGVKGRMEVVPTPGKGTVLIDYAHTPDALENALTALRDFTPGRLICLFGCGGDRDRTKRPIMGGLAAELADLCVVTSDNPRSEEPKAIMEDILAGMEGTDTPKVVESDREKAIALALNLLEEGDVLLLAGKGHETYQEVNGVKRHMDEREIVAQHFRGQP
ncbi:MAG: UDP-N-acetylmuramoyl-L-alanyl-D-glutamate--2,6-diaminopimelate ligase [Oscillospiraceae bacterium]|nr:UDP-N-acetylmuramoyl-L-alanyl-D-glutamate--2,6-diaminopimelate ligase [Oscillospiraceae bacterium]